MRKSFDGADLRLSSQPKKSITLIQTFIMGLMASAMKGDDDTSNGSSGGALRRSHRIDFDVKRMNSQAALQQILDFTVGTSTATALMRICLANLTASPTCFSPWFQKIGQPWLNR